MDIAALRMKVAVNHFKHLLLGDLHVEAVHQETDVSNKLAPKCRDVKISDKTWKSWFADPQVIPRIETVRKLDGLALCAIRVVSPRSGEERSLPPDFFVELVHGGLVSEMMRASKSKHPLIALRDRAESYKPISPLHLHLDAIEVGALSEGYGDIPWETVKRVGAERIQNLLTDRWGPRHGTVYSEFTSDLRLEWESSDSERRAEIRRNYARFKPDLFENALNQAPHPAWEKTGIGADVSPTHLYKALFSMASDARFLKADRLVAWSLDLATAALAMHAFAWSDRYTTFDDLMPDELIYWIAFAEIFFSSEPLDAGNTEIIRAMSQLDAEWNEESFSIFRRAKEIYQEQLIQIGIAEIEVFDTAMLATKVHPIRCAIEKTKGRQ